MPNSPVASPVAGNDNGNSNTSTTQTYVSTFTFVSTIGTMNSISTFTNFSSSTAYNSTLSSLKISTPVIVQYTLNETIDASGVVVTNQQGVDASGVEVTHTTFVTNDVSGNDINVSEDLLATAFSTYDDVTDPTSANVLVLNEIKDYAEKIKCTDFQGKGTVDDYAVLFQAAASIAHDAQQMQLTVDINGFNEFGAAADDLSKLFNSFITKLQTISIIDDLAFLRAIAAALKKIWNLSEVFGKFKQTILATAVVDIPKSAHDAKLLVQSVMTEVSCAMNYINHFVDPTVSVGASGNLSAAEQTIISKAVATIDNWSALSAQGVTVAMSNNPDVSYISTASKQLSLNAVKLQANTSTLRSKLAAYNINY